MELNIHDRTRDPKDFLDASLDILFTVPRSYLPNGKSVSGRLFICHDRIRSLAFSDPINKKEVISPKLEAQKSRCYSPGAVISVIFAPTAQQCIAQS